MNMEEFKQKVSSLRQRQAEVTIWDDEPLGQKEVRLMQLKEEIYTALEELEVAEEELSEQSAALDIAKAAIKDKNRRYQELFEEAPFAYLVTDTYGIIREANRAAIALLKVRHNFIVGKPLIIFFTKEMRKNFLSKLNQLNQIERVEEWEVVMQPRYGAAIDVAVSVALVRNREDKPVALRWLLRDITEHKQATAALLRAQVAELEKIKLEKEISIREQVELQLRHNAFHDGLTGLPNRAWFMDRLEHALKQAKRHEENLFAVLFVDLDRFKVINDSLGHIFGDQLLSAIATRLKACMRPEDTVARLGGDEFTILIEGLKDISDALRVARRIQKELALPFVLGKQEVFMTGSIGIALSATGYEQPEDILRDADIAMYRAKGLVL
jgi:diguanylate cyclase (GGDEF)-like protein/PAS domain S-box-containing protein